MKHRLLYMLAFLFATLQTFAQSVTHYTYDDLNRLTSVTYANGTTVSYTYDAVGNRLSRTVNSTAQFPTVITAAVSDIGLTSATCGGNVTSAGASAVTGRGVCWSTNPNPTVSGNHTSNGSDTGSFTSSITGLSPSTTYYVRAYATNSEGTGYGEEVTFSTTGPTVDEKSCPGIPTVTDHEGNVYSTVQIGSQCWTRENMRCTTSPNGYLTAGGGNISDYQAYYYDVTDSDIPLMDRGYLYNWPGAMDTVSSDNIAIPVSLSGRRGICPQGWHVPSKEDWTILTTYLSSQSSYHCDGNPDNIAKALASSEYWNSSTVNCAPGNVPENNNTTGFSAFPVGYIEFNGQHVGLWHNTYFWSSSQSGSKSSDEFYLLNNSTETHLKSYEHYYGDPVRCLRTVRPVVITSEVTSENLTSAIGGGNVTNSGVCAVTARGICWSTFPNPTIADSHTSDGSGMGEYTSVMTGLVEGVYYVRAYATNCEGIAYGNEVIFINENTVPATGNKTITTCDGWVYDNGGSSGNYQNSSDGYIVVNPASDSMGIALEGTYTTESGYDYIYIYSGEGTSGTLLGEYTGTGTFSLMNNGSVTIRFTSDGSGQRSGFAIHATCCSAVLPVVTTSDVSNIDSTSSIGGGIVIDNGTIIISRGVCWSTSPSPTIADSHTTDGNGTGEFTSTITGLTSGTTYYVRAYATNSAGTAYGNEMHFTTLSPPTVTTAPVTNITATTSTCGGNVTHNGGLTVTERGVCWSTSPNPTIADNHTTDGNGTGEFTCSITELTPSTTYYVRAYATNSFGTAYGNEISFTTMPLSPPTVTTTPVTNITAVSSTCGGNVTYNGGLAVTERGVCWSTSPAPTLADNHTSENGGTGEFTSTISGLVEGTTYYVRAYATNSLGTAYGNEVVFIAENTIPSTGSYSLTTCDSWIYDNGGSSGDYQNSSDGYIVVNPASEGQGIALEGTYSTESGYDYLYVYSGEGTSGILLGEYDGTGTFSSTYNGSVTIRFTSDGSVRESGFAIHVTCIDSVTPAVTTASITTSSVTDITGYSATCGGNVIDDGGATVTARGICWGTSPNPTVSDNHTSDGSGTGEFTSAMTGLTPNTTYHVRAYATNSVGTVYGEEMTFTSTTAETDTSCFITIEMHDSFGDGWNGNKIIVHNHGTTQEVTLNSGSDGSATVTVYNGPIDLEWVNGSWLDEVSFSVSGSSCLQYSGGAPSEGTFLSSVIDCSNNGIPAVPAFSYWTEETNNSVIVHFQNSSSNAESFEWNFGDGATSTEQSPIHTYYYQNGCTYPVTLSASNSSCGDSNATTSNVVLNSYCHFSYWTESTCNSVIAHFENQSSGNYVYWQFGDGTVSQEYSPVHEYTTSGNYEAIVWNNCNSYSAYVNVALPSLTTTFDTLVCATDLPITWHGHSFTGTETYTETFTTANNCDSTLTLNVTVGAQTALLEDNFNDGVIDPAKWTYTGNAVLEEDGLLKLQQNVTDQDVHLQSMNLNIPTDGKVKMDRRFIVHRSDNSYYGNYYYGSSVFYLNGNTDNSIRIEYNYTTYDQWFGTYLVYSLGGNEGRVRLCDAIFDTWLTESIDLDFTTGALTYQIDTLTVSANVPALASQTVDSFCVSYYPSGWWTGHQHYMDYVSIYGTEGLNSVTTSPVNGITANTAICGGNIPSNDCILFTERGVCWNTSANPTVADAHTSDGSGSGAFTSQLTGLEANSTYHVRAYSINSMGTVYGNDVVFTTTTSTTIPVVATSAVTDITSSSASCGGNVISDGGATVTARGVCWSTSPNPTVSGSHTSDGSGLGVFTSAMTGLAPNTTYYVRAYATNSEETGYGEEVTFTTTGAIVDDKSCPGTPTVTDYDGNIYNTVKIGNQCWMRENLRTTKYADGTDIPASSSSSNSTDPCYYDYSNSGIPLEARGLLYNWFATMNGASSSDSVPSGVQGACPTGWHVPSHAEWLVLMNYVGSQAEYICGGETSHISKALSSTLWWNSCSGECTPGDQSATPNNATGFGMVPAGDHYGLAGYATYFWSSTQTQYNSEMAYMPNQFNNNPNIGDGSANKSFFLSVRCLKDFISGNDSTQTSLPTVTTSSVTSITTSSATCGGNVTDDGGTTVTARGICWSTSQNPTIADSHTTNGSGLGEFTGTLTWLTPNTTYYVRAYAMNNEGTAYGEEVTFTTGCNPLNVTITSDKTAICEGECATLYASGADSYIWSTGENSSNINDCPTITTTYSVTGFDLYGCESAASFTLTVNFTNNKELLETSCDSYEWNDSVYTQSGDYTQTFTNASGCDSVVTLHLTVNHPVAEFIEATVCDSYIWNDSVYTQSGDYTQTFTTANGCDSVVTLHLTVNHGTHNVEAETACESFTWHGATYTTSGTYTYEYNNADSCASVDTLILTVNYSSTGDTTAVACDSFDWYEQTNLNQSGDYTRTVSNVAGCDSVVTLHLTINSSVTEFVEATACNSYEWNGQTYTTSGNYTQSFTASNGCDSVVTLFLTLNHAETAEFAETACDSFTWNGETYTSSGDYTQTFTNANGCDSVVTLHLTIYPTPIVTVTADNYYVCESGEVAFTTEVAPAGLYNYAWTINDAPQTVNTATVTTVANGSGPISASVVVSFANASAPCTASDTIDTPVIVVEQPSWTNVSVSDNSSCLGETILLEATIQGGVNNSGDTNNYIQWVVSDINGYTQNVMSGSGGSAYDIPAVAGIYIYTPTFVGNLGNGCQLTNTNVVQNVVTVHEPPAAQFISGNGTIICENDPNASAELVIAFMGVAPFTYQVVDEHGNVVAHATTFANSTTLYVAPSTQTTYTINMVQDSYCETTGLSSNASATVHVSAPIYTDLYGTTCDHYTLNTVTYYESGDYIQVFPAANGCDSIITLHLTVNSPVTKVIEVSTSDSCYTWNSETYCESGIYTQTLQTIDGCDSVVILFLTVSVGIDDHNDFAFNLYPNPTNGIVNVQSTNHNSPITHIHVFDAYGKLVDVVETNAHGSSAQTTQIDLSGFAAGVYFVKAVADENVVAVRKIVKK